MIARLASLDRATLIAAAVIIIACVIAWVSVPSPTPLPAAKLISQPFSLPNQPEQKYAQWNGMLSRHNPWQEESVDKASDPAQAKAQAWSIVGIVLQGHQRFALIKQGETGSRKYREGETLPDGTKITAIADDRLQVLAEGKAQTYNIYRH